MSINDIMKLQGVGGANGTKGVPGGAATTASKSEATGNSAAKGAGQSGVAVEVKAPIQADEPPVNADRVSEIRTALKEGSYPLVPAKIADAMIAARLSLVVTS